MIRADLHVHTIYSNDSTLTPKALVEKLAVHNSIKVAAITDHNTVRGLNETRKLAEAYSDILIIPGVEISTIEGDLLVLGAKEIPPEPWILKNVLDFARDNNFVSVVAHPYRKYGMGDLARTYKFDAIEILNGESSPTENRLAKKLAKSMKLPGVAGSDAHNLFEALSVYTKIQASLNIEEILMAIEKGWVTAHLAARSIHF